MLEQTRIFVKEIVTEKVSYLPKRSLSTKGVLHYRIDLLRNIDNYSKNSNVLHRLAEIAEYCVKMTGFFQSGQKLYCNEVRPHARYVCENPLRCQSVLSSGRKAMIFHDDKFTKNVRSFILIQRCQRQATGEDIEGYILLPILCISSFVKTHRPIVSSAEKTFYIIARLLCS